MNDKTMNNLIAERAKVHARVKAMVEAGVKPEDQANYNQAVEDFKNLTAQIDDLKDMASKMDKIEDVFEPVKNLETNSFANFIRFGDTSGIEKFHNAVGIGTASAGYTVPEDLYNQIVTIMYESGAMLNIADVINTRTLTDLPVDGTAPTAYWISESGTYSTSDPTVTRIQLGANKVGVMVPVTEELLADSAFNIEQYIARLAGTAMGRSMENEFINGTVSGRPTGFLGSATQALTSSVTNSFNYANLVSLFAAVKTPYAQRGTWITGRAALATIMTLQDGASQYVFQPSYNAGQPDMLLGRPLVTSEYMPALTTTAKGIAFGDFSYYKVAMRGGMNVQRLNELYAGNGQVAFKFNSRVDGKLALAEAVKTMACL